MRTLILSIQLLYFFLNSVIFGKSWPRSCFTSCERRILTSRRTWDTENVLFDSRPIRANISLSVLNRMLFALHSDFTRPLTHNPLLLLEHCHLKYFRNASVSEDVTRVQQISVFADKNVQISVEAKLHNSNDLHRDREKEKEREERDERGEDRRRGDLRERGERGERARRRRERGRERRREERGEEREREREREKRRERERERERERKKRKRERESLFGCSMMPSSRSAPRHN